MSQNKELMDMLDSMFKTFDPNNTNPEEIDYFKNLAESSKINDRNPNKEKVMSTVTLRTLLKEHPEWADLPITVYEADGHLATVGDDGSVYLSELDADTLADGDYEDWVIERGSSVTFAGN